MSQEVLAQPRAQLRLLADDLGDDVARATERLLDRRDAPLFIDERSSFPVWVTVARLREDASGERLGNDLNCPACGRQYRKKNNGLTPVVLKHKNINMLIEAHPLAR